MRHHHRSKHASTRRFAPFSGPKTTWTGLLFGVSVLTLGASAPALAQEQPVVDLTDPNVSVDLSVLNDGGLAPQMGAPLPAATTAGTTGAGGYRPPGAEMPVSTLYIQPSAGFSLPPQTKSIRLKPPVSKPTAVVSAPPAVEEAPAVAEAPAEEAPVAAAPVEAVKVEPAPVKAPAPVEEAKAEPKPAEPVKVEPTKVEPAPQPAPKPVETVKAEAQGRRANAAAAAPSPGQTGNQTRTRSGGRAARTRQRRASVHGRGTAAQGRRARRCVPARRHRPVG
ncbi:hypothetical protein ACFL12_04325 [Pseudomonadota bacterium]